MLSEAHQQLERGVHVVIGFIETHSRAETAALVDGLPAIPLREFDYRGATLREPDTDAIIALRPQLVLIDELPHTNAQGSRHKKRWQDIEEILDAGINVYTAMNIQHLESLNDVVAQVTGVRVQETVPDAFLDGADEIEVIDIPPGELQQRLKEGKVYVAEKVDQALEGFFKTANLTALRELALRRAADTVDAEMRKLRTQEGEQGPWATRERVVVCVAPNRMGSRVVRAAARLGAASHAEIIAVTVDSDRQASRSEDDRAHATEALDLAKSLGMEVVTLSGHDIVQEVFRFASKRNANLVVVGKPIRPRWKELLFGSVVDEMVRASGDVDVYVITTDDVEKPPAPRLPLKGSDGLTFPGLAFGLALIGLATVLGFLLLKPAGLDNVAMLFVLSVSIAACRTTRWESVATALVAVLSYNFCFVEPRFSFAVSDIRDIVLLIGMLSVGLVISSLTQKLKTQLASSSERERRNSSLYRLSQLLAQNRGKRKLAAVAANEIRSVFDGDVAVFLLDEGRLVTLAASNRQFELNPPELAVASWVGEHKQPAGFGTDTLPGSSALYLPLLGAESQVGVLGFQPGDRPLDLSATRLLETFANSLGLALERALLAKESNDARVQAETERIRSTLLSSISHDLRTPLTSITGAATSLREGNPNQETLIQTIQDESMRLNHQIQNLLDMTRLQSGGVELDLEWHLPQDLVATALDVARPSLGEREVHVQNPDFLPLLRVDGLLIEKALVNLIENAGRYTPPNAEISIATEVQSGDVLFHVRDNGPGIPETNLAKLFMPGYRTSSGGYGLGLAVVKAVCDLHGGKVRVRNRDRGGAEFTLAIPLPPDQPEAPHE
ncbi:MAG: sensor histidine kinase KdpD [Armatimonadetes bacterium]|nr:sensor histidine kinase KdpD [Armatimonadota bacterium]